MAAAGNNVVSYTGKNTRKDLQLLSAGAASDRADNRAYSSNWGPGVDVFGPGSDVYFAWAWFGKQHINQLAGQWQEHGDATYSRDGGVSESSERGGDEYICICDNAEDQDPRGSPDLLIDNNSRKRSMLIQS